MSNLRAERTMTETWTTQSGNKVELTFTVYAWWSDWSCKTTIEVNGKAGDDADFGKINGMNVVKFDQNTSKPKAVPVSDKIVARTNEMIQWAKNVVKEGADERHELSESQRRADRS